MILDVVDHVMHIYVGKAWICYLEPSLCMDWRKEMWNLKYLVNKHINVHEYTQTDMYNTFFVIIITFKVQRNMNNLYTINFL